MKYFLSNKINSYLDYKHISTDDFLLLNEIVDDLLILPGVFEACKNTDKLLARVREVTNSGSQISLSFINIQQVFIDAAYNRIDPGIAHLVCKGIERPFNSTAAINSVKESGLRVGRVWFEENQSLIRMTCHND